MKSFLPRGIHNLFHTEGTVMRSQQREYRNSAKIRGLDTSIGLYGHCLICPQKTQNNKHHIKTHYSSDTPLNWGFHKHQECFWKLSLLCQALGLGLYPNLQRDIGLILCLTSQ